MENGLGDERMVLDTIKGPEDVKRLSEEERKELAAEIRGCRAPVLYAQDFKRAEG